MNSVLIIAGEKSGEEHALSFFRELKSKQPHTHFYGVGGDTLKNEGMELLYHLKDFSSWGISEVVAKIPFYMKAFKTILSEVEKRKTKVVILIDFQDFNLRLARKLKKKGVNVLYYVAPQAWAWKEYRAQHLQESVHTLFTIIPFEKDWFLNRGVSKVISIDHPLLTTYKNDLATFDRKNTVDFSSAFTLLCLPGSRNFEVQNLLPLYVKLIKKLKLEYPHMRTSIVCSESVKESNYKPFLKYFDDIYQSPDLSTALKKADISLAASGTVTLATALYALPTLICYKSSFLNEYIFFNIINYKGPIGLANIVHQKMIFPELVQNRCNEYEILKAFKKEVQNYSQNVLELKNTKAMVSGELQSVADYMSKVIEVSYAI